MRRFFCLLFWGLLSLTMWAQSFGLPLEWGVADVCNLYSGQSEALWVLAESGVKRPLPGGEIALCDVECNGHPCAMFGEGEDTLWIAQTQGLTLFIPRTGETKNYRLDWNERTRAVSSIVRLPLKGRKLLLGTYGYKFIVWDAETGSEDIDLGVRISALLEGMNGSIECMSLDRKGRVWVCTRQGVVVLDVQRMERMRPSGMEERYCRALACDPRTGLAFVGSPDDGLWACDAESGTSRRVSSLPVSALHFNADGRLLVGTDNRGLFVMEGDKLKTVALPYGYKPLERYKINRITTTTDGDICLALYHHGLMVLPVRHDGFTLKSIDLTGGVNAICHIDSVTTAYGSDGGGVLISSTLGERCFADITSVQSLAASEDGTLWVGTFYDGLFCITPEGKVEKPVSRDMRVMALAYDPATHLLYIGTNGEGVLCYNAATGGLRRLEGKYYDWVRSLAVVPGCCLYVGQEKYISRVDFSTGRVTAMMTADSLNYRPNQMAMSHGMLWVATDKGLLRCKLTDNVLQRVGEGMDVLSVSADKNGRLWLCTASAVCYCPAEDGGVTMFRPHGLHRQAGVFSVQSASLSPSGIMMMGCEEGVVEFRPQEVINGRGRRRTGIWLNGLSAVEYQSDAPIEFATRITLSHRSPAFSVSMAPTALCTDENLHWEYSLAGYEEVWHSVSGPAVSVGYSALPPGDYVLTVRLNGEERTLSVIVTPPWYATWWARLLFALLIAAIVAVVVYEIRLRRRQEANLRLLTEQLQIARRSAASTNLQDIPIDSRSEDQKLMKKVTEAIKANLGNPDFTVEQLASEVAMSRIHLHRRLKKLVGMPASDLIRTMRLRQAAYLLTHSHKTAAQIAYTVGFATPSHFSNTFTTHFGLTPIAFAEKYKETPDIPSSYEDMMKV